MCRSDPYTFTTTALFVDADTDSDLDYDHRRPRITWAFRITAFAIFAMFL